MTVSTASVGAPPAPSGPPRARRHTQRNLTALVVLALAVVGATALSLSVGARAIPLAEVWEAVLGRGTSPDTIVITSQRVPRTLMGLAVGLAFGAAGALMQGHTRNPLAEPGLFGVNAGASLAVAIVAFTVGFDSPAVMTAAALVGALATSAAVFLLGLGSLRGSALVMLAVIGTALGQLFGALTSSLVLLDNQTLDVMRFWEAGSISNGRVDALPVASVLIAIGLVLALANAFAINSLGLGHEVATALGRNVMLDRLVGILAISLLAGAAVSLAGPVAFVGLVAPHAARLISGHDYRWLLPQSALVGAAVLLLADVAGRVVAPPGELQVGIVMSALGAPILLAVARRRRVVAL